MLSPSNSNSNPVHLSSLRQNHHRRAQSELSFLPPEDVDLSSDPSDAPAGSFNEFGSENDLFNTYLDMDQLRRSDLNDSPVDNDGGGRWSGGVETSAPRPLPRHRHWHCNSVDSSNMFSEAVEAKKAISPDKLVELWNVDPKRVKRILANRQSAARSKERKARYVSELERKVQNLQTEATTLAAQLTLFQRDTSGLTAENAELKHQLQAMEQQAQLHDALNEALKQEVERLRITTREMVAPSDTFNLAMPNVPYTQSTIFSHQQQPGPSDPQNVQMTQLCQISAYKNLLFLAAHKQHLSDSLQHDPLVSFQGLDISRRVSHLVKSEGPSLSASESNSEF